MIVRAVVSTLGVLAIAIVFHWLGTCGDTHVTKSEITYVGPYAPVVVVTKSEITYQGHLVSASESRCHPAPDGSLHCDEPGSAAAPATPTCGEVMEHLNSALFTYDPKYVALAGTYATRVLASCHDDGWPDALKHCIVSTPPRALLDHACDKQVSDELAQKVLARVAPGQNIRPADFLQR